MRATLLMATAHRLVQADPIHPLSRYYPSLGGFDGVDSETWPLFRSFLLERADKARALIASRYTQTNEVRRAALLYPGVARAAKELGGKVALLEVGCSAGLLLGLDRFNYRYQCDGGEQLAAGPAKAAVGLHCALDLAPGAVAPKLPKKLAVTARAGLDRAPVDLSDEDELAWLEACVWADQPDRIRLLRTAAAEQAKHRPSLITGDGVDDLASAASSLEGPLVVLTSHVAGVFHRRRAGRSSFLRWRRWRLLGRCGGCRRSSTGPGWSSCCLGGRISRLLMGWRRWAWSGGRTGRRRPMRWRGLRRTGSG